MKKVKLSVLILSVLSLFFLLLLSCTNSEAVVSSTDFRPYITESGRMGLSFWVRLSGYDSVVSMELKSPDNEYRWELPVQEVEFNSMKYKGSSDAVMPAGVALPQGKWSVLLLFKDGSTYQNTFRVSYREPAAALERSQKAELPFFDSVSNLTVLPDF